MTPIYPEIFIRGKHGAFVDDLRQANNASIGETHWLVRIFSDQSQNVGPMTFKSKIDSHSATLDRTPQFLRLKPVFSKQERCLRNNRLASHHRIE